MSLHLALAGNWALYAIVHSNFRKGSGFDKGMDWVCFFLSFDVV